MKRLLLVSTGGTIACTQHADGLAPQTSGLELLDAVPLPPDTQVEICDLMCVDSSDMSDARRLSLAHTLWENREQYDGFVVTHGTDTMAYTAAFLCHVLAGFDRPVILTGSQKPMAATDSDAPRNLRDALLFAASDYRGTAVCFAGKLRRGDCVTKADAQALDAFGAGNSDREPDGVIQDDIAVLHAYPMREKPHWVEPSFPRAAVLTITPLLDEQTLAAMHGCEVLLLYGYGVGDVPKALLPALRQLTESGVRVYLGAQCPHGQMDMSIYEAGQRAAAVGIRPLGTRTREDAVACIQCGIL